jgi:hypothetical protein
MKINLSWDSSVSAAPSGFQADIQRAATILGNAILNPITVTIQVGWGEIGGTLLSSANESEGGPSSATYVNYGSSNNLQAIDLLINQSTLNNTSNITAGLPSSNPFGSGYITISAAQAKALGVSNPYATTFDGMIGIGTAFLSNAVIITAALHELGHALGRVPAWVDSNGVSWYTPFALYTYSAPGQLWQPSATASSAAATSGGYFSVDGGKTNLGNFSGGDSSDFVASIADPFSLVDQSITTLTPLDLLVIESQGYQIASPNEVYFVVQQNAQGRNSNGINGEYNGIAPGGQNSVIGLQSATLSSGYNVVILNGARSEYQVQVDGTGNVLITDTATNTTVNDKGISYILFDGGAINAAGSYSSAYFINNSATSQVAELYNAAFHRQPDLPGLEYWESSHQNGASMLSIAQGFVSSAEFLNKFPAAAAAPDGGGPHDQAFVTTLYQNVLGRAPDPSGFAYWTNDLASGDSRANVLLQFAISTENVADISASTSSGGWLINTGTGGYADQSVLLAATTVLSQGVTNNYINLVLVDPTTLTAPIQIANTQMLPVGGSSFGSGESIVTSDAAMTIVLSSSINIATLNGSGETVHSAVGGNSVISFAGNGDTIFLSGSGSQLIEQIQGGVANGSVIYGFAGGDTVSFGAQNALPVQMLVPTVATPLAGATLAFSSVNYVINLGTVASGSAADVAAAANSVYKVADVSGEAIVFMAQNSVGNTVLYDWQAPGGADVNHNHHVDAGELAPVITLLGVPAASIQPAMFH